MAKIAGLNYMTGFIGTAYDPSLGGINTDGSPDTTATGKFVYNQTVAVSPTVIPYGSIIHVHTPSKPQYDQIWLASDTGGAIRNENGGKRVDLGLKDAMEYGKQDVQVAIIVKGTGVNDAQEKAKNWNQYVAKYSSGSAALNDSSQFGGGIDVGDGSALGTVGKAFQYNSPNMILGTSPNVEDDEYPKHRYASSPFVLRIGDSQFFIPPLNITQSKKAMVEGRHTLRAKSPNVIKSGWTSNYLSIRLAFADTDQINGWKVAAPGGKEYHMDGLRALLAQFYKNPFLPIRNELINNRLGIFNVALQSINIATDPDFPNLVYVDLVLVECTMEAFLGLPDLMYDLCFNYPMWRWFYQQMLMDKEQDRYESTYLRPVPKFMNGKVFFRTLDPEQIGKMEQDVLDKAKISANKNGYNENINMEYALSNFNSADIRSLMTEWDLDDLIVQNVQVSIVKTLTPLNMDTYEMPMFQDVGGMDRFFSMTYYCKNRDELESLEGLVRHCEAMAREHRHRFVGGFIEVHNEIVNMAGIEFAMIEGMDVTTVEGVDDNYIVNMTFREFNPAQKNNERLNGVNTPLQDYSKRMNKEYKEYIVDTYVDSKTNRKNSIMYEGMVEHAFKQLELYPDLGLPSYELADFALLEINQFRVNRKQSKMPFDKFPRTSTDVWCEPDFYMIYPQIEDAFRAINAGDFGGKMVQLLMDGTYEDIANMDDGATLSEILPWGKDEGSGQGLFDRISPFFTDNSFNPFEAQETYKETVSTQIDYVNEDYKVPIFQDWDEVNMIPTKEQSVALMMHDMMRYDTKFRLSKAFPTYMFLFIDEGVWVDGRRLWNNYYAYHAIHEISITKDKNNPVDLAYIRLSNIYGTFNADTKMRDPSSYNNDRAKTGVERLKELYKAWSFSPEDAVVQARQLMEHANLKEGARVHIRLGYSSNSGNMPICFNGHIASVNDGTEIEIVAQGDGAELIAQPLSTDPGEGTPNEPHNAFQKYLTARQSNYWFSVSSDFEFFNNYESRYGIEHFGYVESLAGGNGTTNGNGKVDGWFGNVIDFLMPKSWEDEAHKIAEEVAIFFTSVLIDNISWMASVITGHPNFNTYDVMKNIYRGSFQPSTGVLDYEKFDWSVESWKKFASNTGKRWDIFDGEKNVNFSAYNKTLWDLGQQYSMFVPEFICAPHSHGLRSTLFFGMPHWPVKYEYYKPGGVSSTNLKDWEEKHKPFQQLHVYSSGLDILHNGVQASSEHIKHVATGIYARGDTSTIVEGITVYADRSIMSDQVKSMIVDTGVLQDIFGHDATIDFVTKYVVKPAVNSVVGLVDVVIDGVAGAIDLIPTKWADDLSKKINKQMDKWDWVGNTDEYMSDITQPGKVAAEAITIGALQRNFMEMYQGELIVLGDGSVKPWDLFYMNDVRMFMSGTAQVGKVTHSLSRSTGFTTTIKPDLIVGRTEGRGGRNYVLTTATTVATAIGMISLRRMATSKVVRWMSKQSLSTTVTGAKAIGNRIKVKKPGQRTKVSIFSADWAKSLGAKGNKGLGVGLKLVKGNIFLALLTGGITEYLMSWYDKETKYNNVIYIYPLWKGGEPFTAGVRGAAHIIPNYIDPRYADPLGAGTYSAMNASTPTKSSGFIHPLMQPTKIGDGFKIPSRPQHMGVDMHSFKDKKQGFITTYIYAVADGTVTYSQKHETGGNMVNIEHNINGKKIVTKYLHMKDGTVTVKKGDKVKQGHKLGTMGSTGRSTGTHLHFEVHENGKAVDPIQFYKKMGGSLS